MNDELVERLRTRGGRPDGFGLGRICDEAADEIERLTARAEAAEAECLEQARLLGMSGERELALRTELFNATAHGELKTLEALARNKALREPLREALEHWDYCRAENRDPRFVPESWTVPTRQALGAEHGK